MGTRFYVERSVVHDDGEIWPEIIAHRQSFEDALELALDVVVVADHDDALAILVGDEDGPHETAARLEHVKVAESFEAIDAGAKAVLTIEALDHVPRGLVASALAGPRLVRIQVATQFDDISVPLYVQLQPGLEVDDDASRRYRMMEFGPGQGEPPEDDEDDDDDTAKRFRMMELNAPMSKERRAKYDELRRLSRDLQALDAKRMTPSEMRRRHDDLTGRIDKLRHELGLDSSKEPKWPSPARNPAPYQEDVDAAVDKFKEFHRYDPKKLQEVARLQIPLRVKKLGPCKYVLYRSGKVDPATMKKPSKPVDYIHEHDAGVIAYSATPEADTDVPAAFHETTALVYLGKCLGFAVKDGPEAEATEPLPDLCCTPDGKCLLVVQNRKKVLAMMWGGALGVFARGIDG
jgi:hypothetical protein